MIHNVDSTQFKELIEKNKNGVIIDVRTEEEVQDGRIEGARNINMFAPDFSEKIKSLDKNGIYFMVCRSGNRSGSASGFMESQGFKSIYNLDGGMMAWNGPVVL